MKRSFTPEIMDDFSIRDKRIDAALKELKTINRFLGGNAATLKGTGEILESSLTNKSIRILDAGSGASDIMLPVGQHNSLISIVCLDINSRACLYASQHSPGLKSVCGNAFAMPFKPGKFDLVHASLFLHHFTSDEIKKILTGFLETARYGIVINDLRRSVPAFLGIKILTSLFSRSQMVKNDAPLSVRRGFVKKELVEILNEMKISRYKIKRKWAFRWLVIVYKN